MAVIRDVMPAFDLLQPTSIADAQKLLQQQGSDGWVLAGGMDSFDWLKDRIKKPKVVVDLSGIAELKGIRSTADGIEIGGSSRASPHQSEVQAAGGRCGTGSLAADPKPGHHRWQCFAGRSLLVLPRGLALLPRWWKHLLCRHTGRP
jgi:hypothetical protein